MTNENIKDVYMSWVVFGETDTEKERTVYNFDERSIRYDFTVQAELRVLHW